jgi:ribosomal protein L37AE/L43A
MTRTPPNIQSMKRSAPKCHRCEKPVPASKPRLVIEGHWHCTDCAYELEYGEVEKPKRPRPKKQTETLFPLPEPVSDVRRRA